MQKINVLLAEDTRDSKNILAKALLAREDINLLPIASNGHLVIEYVKQYRVHILLLDLVLPGIDGISIISKINEMNLAEKPVIVVCTALSSELIIGEAFSLGASHCLLKPADPDYIIDRALEVYIAESYRYSKTGLDSQAGVYRLIHDVLRELQVPPHLLGYQYLKACILVAINNHGFIYNVTTELYPRVAKEFDSTPKRVERVIRHAIEVTWDRARLSTLHEFFGYSVDKNRGRPTNSEFIARIADIILTRCA